MPERRENLELLDILCSVESLAARTLYETDEDITDEAISALIAKGFSAWHSDHTPRQRWEELAPEIRHAYVRRAKAVLALIEDTVRNIPSAPGRDKH